MEDFQASNCTKHFFFFLMMKSHVDEWVFIIACVVAKWTPSSFLFILFLAFLGAGQGVGRGRVSFLNRKPF